MTKHDPKAVEQTARACMASLVTADMHPETTVEDVARLAVDAAVALHAELAKRGYVLEALGEAVEGTDRDEVKVTQRRSMPFLDEYAVPPLAIDGTPWIGQVGTCTRCGRQPSTDCGYRKHNYIAGAWECTAVRIDTINPSRSCLHCPLAWCSPCQAKARVEREAAY